MDDDDSGGGDATSSGEQNAAPVFLIRDAATDVGVQSPEQTDSYPAQNRDILTEGLVTLHDAYNLLSLLVISSFRCLSPLAHDHQISDTLWQVGKVQRDHTGGDTVTSSEKIASALVQYLPGFNQAYLTGAGRQISSRPFSRG